MVVLVVTAVEPPDDAAHVAVVPLEVKTYPFVPIANLVALLTPFPMIKSPVDVIGDKALNAALAVVWPVPPFAIGNAVPEYVIANVPLVVIGDPEIDKNDGTVAATLVTVPVEETVAQLVFVPSVVRYLPELVA